MYKNKGFTLIELLVVVSIIAVISTVIIFNHKKFNDNLELTNLSYEVALALRQAQVYGVSTKDFNDPTATEEERFGLAYGVHFDIKYPTSFVFFADRDGDKKYTGSSTDCADGSPDACLELFNIGKGNKIKDLCDIQSNGNYDCGPGNSVIKNEAHITFIRPEPDATLRFTNNAHEAVSTPNTMAICLVSPQGKIKEIRVYKTGQISIYDGICSESSGHDD